MNYSTFPNGGWQFYEPATKWTAPNPMNYDFHSMARLIQQHRIANHLPSSLEKAMSDLEAYTKARFPNQINTQTNAQPRVSGCRSCGGKG
jgi:hypothetical protein